MRKIILRAFAVILVAAMLVALFAGCKKKEGDSLYVPPEFVFVAQSMPIPSDIGDVGNLVSFGGKAYLSTNTYEYDTDGYAQTNHAALYSMNLDGTGISALPNYAFPRPTSIRQDAYGGISINGLQVDAQGNLWVSEYWRFYGYDLPNDFDPEKDEAWNYYEDYGNGTTLRKLDNTGAELLAVDIAPLQGDAEWFYISAWGLDGAGNLYLTTENWDVGGRRIHVLDSNGDKQFHIDVEAWFDQFISLPDGNVAFPSEGQDASGNWTRGLQAIDFATKALGEVVPIPTVGWSIYPGSGDYDILIGDSSNLHGYKLGQEVGEPVKLLSWLESDILNNNIRNITMLSEEEIICISTSYDRVTYENTNELLILKRTPYADLPVKTVLTLATLYLDYYLQEAVVLFNRTNPDYRIHVIDYAEFNSEGDWNAGLTRLSTEIISGKLPDILAVSNLPYKEYAARGLLADLYTMIDADPSFNRSDFVQGAFHAAEIDGKLYQIFSSFYIISLTGNPNVLGPEPGWTMDEFSAVLAAHPEADMPLGQWLTRENMLQGSIAFSIDDYIDWAGGKVYFDTPQFIQLLELCMRFPSDYDYSEDNYVPQDEAIATGRQIMVQTYLSDFSSIMWNKQIFGGEIVFKGFPNESRAGNSLLANNGIALIETSRNKDAAWSFIRTMLDETWQLANSWSFPTNQAAFDKKAQETLDADYGIYGIAPAPDVDGGSAMFATEFTHEDIDQIVAVINSTSSVGGWNVEPEIWAIISENASDFFNGTSTAADTARIIQSRVSILVSERS